MITILGRYNGSTIELLEKVHIDNETHVLVVVLEGELERSAARIERQSGGAVSVPLLTPDHYLEATKKAIASATPQSKPQAPFSVGEVMTPRVVTINSRMSVSAAAHLMAREGITSVLVEPGAIGDWGIMTIRDVLDRIVRADRSADHVAVGEIATRPLITVTRDTTLRECSELMVEKRIRRAVIMENEQPIGIISETDIFRVVEQHGWEPQMSSGRHEA